jgi:hypothetical protein
MNFLSSLSGIEDTGSISLPVPIPDDLYYENSDVGIEIEVKNPQRHEKGHNANWKRIKNMQDGIHLKYPLSIRPTVSRDTVGKLIGAYTNGSNTKDSCKGSIKFHGIVYSITGGVKEMGKVSGKSTPNGWNYSEVEVAPGKWVKTSFIRPGTQNNGKYRSGSEKKRKIVDIN